MVKKSEKNKTTDRRWFYFSCHLGSKNGDSVAEDLGYQVDYPEHEAKTEEAEDTDNEGNDVLGLKETDDAIQTADKSAEEDLKKDLNDLRKGLVGSGERIVSHGKHSFVII